MFQIFKPEDCLNKNSTLTQAGICQDGLSSDKLLKQYSHMLKPESPVFGQSSSYGKVCPDVFRLDSAIRVSGIVLSGPCHEKIVP